MRAIRRGETGPAVHEIRSILIALELLPASPADDVSSQASYDEATETAVR
ncbi:MAG: hypothetical protein QOC94_2150, partial [Actinoplanes sp.]|nr:hypothetical protein [Actinoplanes sp.]